MNKLGICHGFLVTIAAATMPYLTQSAAAQTGGSAASRPTAALVELFTSEGCSSCPPADELLRQVAGHRTADGLLIIGLSEHVSYWNGLGWKDPFSSDVYTARQNAYSSRLGLDSVYTPQMVVNGREQFVGSSRRDLDAAFKAEAQRKSIGLRILSSQTGEKEITFRYAASELPPKGALDLIAVLVDDMDRSSVLRGENSGRDLSHAFVARALAPLGTLRATDDQAVTLPLPTSFAGKAGAGHHLVLFAQQSGTGAVVGVDAKPI